MVLWLLAESTPRANFWAAVVYSITTITDFLDGWLARRSKTTSRVGALIDPIAELATVYRSLSDIAILRNHEIVRAGGVLHGFELDLTRLFNED